MNRGQHHTGLYARKSISSGRFCSISSPSHVNSKLGKMRLTSPSMSVVVFMSISQNSLWGENCIRLSKLHLCPSMRSNALEIGVHDLDGDLTTCLALGRAMYLRKTGDSDRLGIKRREESGHGSTNVGQEQLLNVGERGWAALILERLH